MPTAVVLRGFGNGFVVGAVSPVVTRGYTIGVPVDSPEPPGYIFRRSQSSLVRVFRRAQLALTRVWSYRPVGPRDGGGCMSLPSLSIDTLIASVDDDRFYGFDLSPVPELIAGETVVSATIVPPSVSGLTIGAPVVNDQTFDGIAPGFLVVVRVSGGTAKTVYRFAARVVLSSGSVITVPARMLKLASF